MKPQSLYVLRKNHPSGVFREDPLGQLCLSTTFFSPCSFSSSTHTRTLIWDSQWSNTLYEVSRHLPASSPYSISLQFPLCSSCRLGSAVTALPALKSQVLMLSLTPRPFNFSHPNLKNTKKLHRQLIDLPLLSGVCTAPQEYRTTGF